MLTEKQINILPERIAERLEAMQTEYYKSIGEAIKKIGELRPKDMHQLQRMYNYGADMDKAVKGISRISGKNVAEIYEMFDIVAKENYNYSKPFYKARGMSFIPYEENETLKAYVQALAKQTAEEYVNLTQHTAFAVFDKSGKSIAPLFESNKNKTATSLSDTYTKITDYAVSKVQLGGDSYQSAMREVVKALANSGIKTVDYATGYTRKLDSAVKQNILWGVKKCNQNTADKIGEEFGADGYEISYHSNPRPTHADMAGKQFAIGKARTINGIYYPSFEDEAEALLEEYGCLHFKYSILLGVSEAAYSKQQLAEFKYNDNKHFEFEGENYTAYEAKQVMSKLEGAARTQKDLATLAKASGDEELRREAQGKINQITHKYHEFSQASGLPTRVERMTLTKSADSGKIKAEKEFSPRKNKTADYSVKWDKVQTSEYENKFSQLSDNEKVVTSAKTRANWCLNNRDGENTEEIYAISLKDGREIGRITDQAEEYGVVRTKSFDAALKNADESNENVLLLHNHPRGLPPSISDINALVKNKNVSGVTIGHDGSMYYYTRPNAVIPQNEWDIVISHYEKYSETTSMEKTLEILSKKYDFIIKKL